ncbi:MAG: NAD(P)-binding domain-containing protein [Defluviitaleaceae bacterium]|nr:NAD(P)-binding domain-containing protein [Defluviitaleaceae bacterium]MCL2262457.1 NAD(P)-binding domain-containing protein [Defluviitaleaceae bacterium]
MNGIILKDDARYDHCENYLKNSGYTFDADKGSDFIIFPFKGDVNFCEYDGGFFAGLEKGTPVFTGVSNAKLAAECEKHGLEYHAMIEEKCVAEKNAVPTSEGVIAYLIANRNETIANSRILVIGYGICGSDLCKRLKGLDAKVYTVVRNTAKEDAARKDGIVPIYLPQLFEKTVFDVIINTVPTRLLCNKSLHKTDNAMMIDIASSPYGFDIEYAKKLNEKSALLPGIPGKFAAKTAGEILGEYIHRVLQGRKRK